MNIAAFFRLSLLLVCVTFPAGIAAQVEPPKTAETLQNIGIEISKISKTLDALNQKLGVFSQTFSSNQGLKLSERQQKILVAFEFLNRAEARLSTLQQLKIQLAERQTVIKRRIAQADDNLRPESIERSLSFRGTTDAEQLRQMRRQTVLNERAELTSLSYDIQNTLGETNTEIRQTEQFLKNIRQRLFPEIERELADL